MATDIIARGMASTVDKTLSERLGGTTGSISFKRLSQADYDALGEYDETTVYYAVDDNGKVTQYLGAAKLSTGSAPISTSNVVVAVTGLTVKTTLSEEEN